MSRTDKDKQTNELRELHTSERKEQERQKKWETKWGDGKSEAEYRELDDSYKSLAAEFKGAITPRLDMSIKDISIWRLERRKCIGNGDLAGAKRLTEMIMATMSSEAMKAGDAKPLEKFRVDALADKLEQRGLMKDGVLSLKGVIEYIQTDKGKFLLSRDAVDAMMLSLLNAYRFNEGLSELPELPKALEAKDPLGELAAEATLDEKNLMTELGMSATWDGGPR